MADYNLQIQVLSWIGVAAVFALVTQGIFVTSYYVGHIIQKLEKP